MYFLLEDTGTDDDRLLDFLPQEGSGMVMVMVLRVLECFSGEDGP